MARAVGVLANPVEIPTASEGGCPISERAERRATDEVAAKDGKLHIALLDKDMNPVKVDAQSISATGGTREKPVKLEVTKSEGGFTITAPKSGEWLIVQYKDSESAKPITARMHYDEIVCAPCTNPEWLCTCGEKK